jgi:hypothetical protein
VRLALALLAALVACADLARAGEPAVDERLVQLRSERTALQARADGAAQMALLLPMQVAGLLTDALSARAALDSRALDELPAPRRQAFAALATLDEALKEALAYPGAGTQAQARAAADRATKALEALASDDQPLVLQVTPRVVPPRLGGGELAMVPREPPMPPAEAQLRPLQPAASRAPAPTATVVRYVPEFAAGGEEDPAVEIEIVGLRLAGDAPATLTIGAWRGEAKVAPERLHFSVPRNAFESGATRAGLATALLALRRAGRLVTFELAFLVLPDLPGSVALDQKLRWMVPEENTLMSPEIMVRAAAGDTRSLRRCFDPPTGWHFDKAHRRVVIVERLGWLDDISDPTLNGGTVEFAGDEGPEQACLVVSAKPATQGARTATIGRFEATLTREQPLEKAVQSGVRALDWGEAVRLPLEPEAVERKLYVRLFGEIVREFADPMPSGVPFLRITREDDMLVLRADPSTGP